MCIYIYMYLVVKVFIIGNNNAVGRGHFVWSGQFAAVRVGLVYMS